MSRFPGNIIKLPNVTPTQSSASGVWSLKDQMVYQRNNLWPFQRDPYFNYTTLLLQGNVPNTTGPQAMNLPLAYNSDASSNNFLITPNGDVSPRPFSPYGGGNYSNHFDGAADFLGVANNALVQLTNATAFTIEAWVYPISIANNPQIVFAYNPSSPYQGYSLRILTSSGLFEMFDGTSWISFGAAQLNTWQHIAVSYEGNGTTRRFFINGVQQGPAITVPSTINWTSGGVNISSSGESFNGYISNLRIVKGTAVYTSNFTPPSQPLTAITNTSLLTCQSNRFIDNSTANSGSGFTITVNGTPRITDNSPFVSTDFTTGAGYFDGLNDSLQVADATALDLGAGNFTLETWIYLTSGAGTFRQFFSKYAGGVGIEWYVSNANKLEVYFNGGAGQITSTGSINLNTWYHVALVREGTGAGQTKFYINGSQDGSNQVNLNLDNSTALVIGESGGASNDFPGYVADMRVVKGVAVYTGNFTPPTRLLATSGAASAASYPSTTNVNTSFSESATSLLTLQTRAPSQNINFIDSSPNEFIVTKNGNTTQGTFSPFSPTGWGNYFNGSSYLSFAHASLSANFTVEFWVYRTVGSTAQMFVFLNSGSTSGATIYVDASNYLVVTDGSVVQSPFTGQTVPINAWTHIAVVRSGGTTTGYINGSSVGSNGFTPQAVNSVNIAYYVSANNLYLTGHVSNVRIVNGQALYTGNFTPAAAPLTTSSVGTSGANVASSITGTVSLLTCQSNRFVNNANNASPTAIVNSPSVQAFSPFAPANAVSPLVTGGSGYFDGTTDYLTWGPGVSIAFGTGDFTVECWAYHTSAPTASYYIDARNASQTSTWALLNGLNATGDIGWFNGTTALVYSSVADAPKANSWSHIVYVRSGTTGSLYVNGVRVGTATDSTNYSVSPTTSYIGARWAVSDFFSGYMMGVRIVKGTALYNPSSTTFAVPTTPPTAIPNTSLLLNFTNGAAVDATGKNVVESVGTAQLSTKVTKFAGTGSGYFDASVAYQTIPNTAGLIALPGDFTLELWAYRLDATNNTYFCVFGNQAAGNNGFLFWVTGGSANAIRFYSNGAFVMSGANNAVPLNQWTHIALVRSGTAANNMRCYIDGVEDTAARATNTTAFVGVSGNGLAIGTEYNGSFSGTRAAFYYSNYRLTRYARYTANFNTNLPTGPFPIG